MPRSNAKDLGGLPPDRKGSEFGLGSRVAAGAVLALCLVGGVVGWAATSQLSGAVIAPGVVAVDQNLKTVQHRDGGIVGEIAVREGDVIEAGQVLLRLDDAQTRAELSIVRSQLVELTARRARLQAERDALAAVVFPTDVDLADPAVAVVVNGEVRLFEGNRINRESHRQQLELGVQQIGEEIEGLRAQRAAKIEEASLVDAEYEKLHGLFERGIIEGGRVYVVNRERARLLGERGEIDAAIARAGARISEIRLQIIAIDESARTEAQRELGLTETRISELRDREAAIEDRLSRTDLRAPIAGVVNELNVHTIGGVITPAEVLATIVPADARLKVEVKLATISIDQVSIGQTARLRFSAFNQRTTPEIVGTVTHLAAAATRDPATGEFHYTGDIEVAASELDRLNGMSLMPGMPVEVFISTEQRTALSYLVKPFTDQFTRAFREQ
jgi:HlyD family secretion protein